MNNFQIETLLRKNKFTKRYFLGVFPADKLPRKISKLKTKMLVVNFQEGNLPGIHWCSILITPSTLEFFDSAGLSLEINPHFQEFIKRNVRPLMKYNTKQIQSNESNVCGQYCCLYLIYRAMGKKFKDFLSLFTTDYAENDRKVKRIFNQLYKSTRR